MDYPNFFESLAEAQIRLSGTVVLYDGEPMQVFSLNQKGAKAPILAFCQPVGEKFKNIKLPNNFFTCSQGGSAQADILEKLIDSDPSCGLVRLELTDPKFNKFRPYELGMYWSGEDIIYVERQPNRKTEQGLTPTMLKCQRLNFSNENVGSSPSSVNMTGPEMYRCIRGQHPTPLTCLEKLTDDKYANNAAAFHRHFAFVRGPVDTLFLAYKNDVVGLLPNNDFSQVKISKEFRYTTEAVDELGLFATIK
jgi:hypothetical protein